jgi:methyl-accepting chemotaxis protein
MPDRSISDNVSQLAQSSKQMLDAGEQIAENLNELTQRVERASDRTSQIVKSPWLIAGIAFAAGALILTFSKHQA